MNAKARERGRLMDLLTKLNNDGLVWWTKDAEEGLIIFHCKGGNHYAVAGRDVVRAVLYDLTDEEIGGLVAFASLCVL